MSRLALNVFKKVIAMVYTKHSIVEIIKLTTGNINNSLPSPFKTILWPNHIHSKVEMLVCKNPMISSRGRVGKATDLITVGSDI